jgi:NAD-dependent dihydropyrimidine dehydrogenase PreA subunit
MVFIDEDICNGCGECVPNCHEGALQMIDGKARLISDLMCDGLGACIGHCPVGAITIKKREAEAYNETKVMEIMVEKGKNTVIAHLSHLKEHSEFDFLKEGVRYLKEHESEIPFSAQEVISTVHNLGKPAAPHAQVHVAPSHIQGDGGCPGSRQMTFAPTSVTVDTAAVSGQSQLRQWPVQLHLVNPKAPHFRSADVVLAADCVAFSLGNFHDVYLKGKALAIACPKLDHGSDIYIAKLTSMIDDAKINTLTVMIMEVPCCGGLLQMARQALANAGRKIPMKVIVVGIKGEILSEEWV